MAIKNDGETGSMSQSLCGEQTDRYMAEAFCASAVKARIYKALKIRTHYK